MNLSLISLLIFWVHINYYINILLGTSSIYRSQVVISKVEHTQLKALCIDFDGLFLIVLITKLVLKPHLWDGASACHLWKCRSRAFCSSCNRNSPKARQNNKENPNSISLIWFCFINQSYYLAFASTELFLHKHFNFCIWNYHLQSTTLTRN